MLIPAFLLSTWFGNTLRDWLIAVGVAVAVYGLLRVLVWAVRHRLCAHHGKTENRIDDVVAAGLERTHSVVLLVMGVWVGSAIVYLRPDVRRGLGSVAMIAVLFQTGLWLSGAIVEWVRIQREENLEDNAASVMSTKVLSVAVRLALWSIVVLLALQNLGVDVTALVTGLGIGGVAVALAAQAVLGDLLASISIVTDKPFVIGDFLNVGDYLGAVEDIGLRTTRIRSLSGEQLIFSNNDLIRSRIRNYGRMFERRVVFNIGVTYQTPRAKLEAIPGILREAVEAQEKTRFDRAHFQKFGDSALAFEAVYYVLAADYNLFMDVQQAINLRIHERFEAQEIDFAYPTQTIFLEGDGAADLQGLRATSSVEGTSRQTHSASKPASRSPDNSVSGG